MQTPSIEEGGPDPDHSNAACLVCPAGRRTYSYYYEDDSYLIQSTDRVRRTFCCSDRLAYRSRLFMRLARGRPTGLC